MLGACGGILIASVARAQAPAAEQQVVVSRLEPAALLLGIVDYTRWPRTEVPAVICVTHGGMHGGRLTPGVMHWPATLRRVTVRHVPPDEALPDECEVMLFEGWTALAMREAIRATAQRPVLTLGFGSDFCSDGGMVCFTQATAGWAFEINTDAVARSTLRIHPRVLQLTRKRQRSS